MFWEWRQGQLPVKLLLDGWYNFMHCMGGVQQQCKPVGEQTADHDVPASMQYTMRWGHVLRTQILPELRSRLLLHRWQKEDM